MRRPELLIPASSLEVLKIAVIYGADAVYIGGEAFGLRAKAKNFSMEEMREGIRFAHDHEVKVYVTANILAHNDDLEGVREYFKELDSFEKEEKPDALKISSICFGFKLNISYTLFSAFARDFALCFGNFRENPVNSENSVKISSTFSTNFAPCLINP